MKSGSGRGSLLLGRTAASSLFGALPPELVLTNERSVRMSFRYFENRDCPYYPCHKLEHMNCLFCFCPLYRIPDCGGHYVMIPGKDGRRVKDCSGCLVPHRPEGYDYIIRRLQEDDA